MNRMHRTFVAVTPALNIAHTETPRRQNNHLRFRYPVVGAHGLCTARRKSHQQYHRRKIPRKAT